jgi:L,D-transpeptidase catalytic domain/Putative peptidoglycan binding domain
MRRLVLVLAVGVLVGAAPAWGADITLVADHRIARYDDVVRFRGTVVAAASQEVKLVRNGVVVRSTVASAGRFVFDLRAQEPGSFIARTVLGESAPVALRVQPRLRKRIVGRRRIGHRLLLVGRLLPARAGQLLLGRAPVRVASDGRFRARVPTAGGPRVVRRLRLRPGPGYVAVARPIRVRLTLPALQIGSHGPAVRALKERLWQLRYALPNVDAGFGYRTYEAVIAFQKVHRMARTGRIGRAFWRALWRTSVPRPRVRRGNYLEVDKSRQVLMEIRAGRVERVIHVSTGATGNTPLGTWRVYSEIAGWSWVLWQPMYFLRGFAIHGYPSVPTWPASHGCVRVPMWLATGLRERWGRGSLIRVYA